MSLEKPSVREEQRHSAKGSTIMPWRAPIVCTALLLMFLVAAQFPFADGYRMQRNQSSCYYNGTHFMEGSIVPTKEPCLMCKCTEKTLICALKVCPEQPIPPPRGCILVHKSGSCCPYLQCSKLNLALKNNGDRKKIHFLDYYEKAAQERLENPNSYLRRSDDDEVEDNGACIVNGTVYKSGSAMVSSTLCSYCYCINGRQKCVKPKCALPNQKCAPIFVDSACCPIRYDCSGKTPIKSNALDDQSTVSPNHVRRINNKHYQRTSERRGYRSNGCAFGGHTYSDGEKMKSDDPCEVCYCIRGQRKCTPKKCAPPIKGCTPRVPRGECCAVRYDCKHGEPKPFGRKMEDEESFDFFSILFGPDPDAPKAEAKNVTEIVEAPVTEAAPVSTTSEKSFLDLLRAGLDFIDDAGEDELLLTSTPSPDVSKSTSTESAPELQTVKVEIIQEPQAIYIEKPDFNFPVRKIPPVPIMFKPLPKIPNLLMNDSNFQKLESESLLKENPTEVSNSLTEAIVRNSSSTEDVEDKTVQTSPAPIPTTTIPQTTSLPTTEKQHTTTSAPTTVKTTQRVTTTTTSTTRISTTNPTAIPTSAIRTTTIPTTTTSTTTTSTTSTTPTTTTSTTTTTPTTTTSTTTTTPTTTTSPTPTTTTPTTTTASTAVPTSSIPTTPVPTTLVPTTTTTSIPSTTTSTTSRKPLTTSTVPPKAQTTTTEEAVSSSVSTVHMSSSETTPPSPRFKTSTPIPLKEEKEQMTEKLVPSATAVSTNNEKLPVITGGSVSSTEPSVTNIAVDLVTSYASAKPIKTVPVSTTATKVTTSTTTTTKPPPVPKIVATTPKSDFSTPVDVVIKIDQLVDKATVETILNSLNAKIEKVTKVTDNEPITTTTIATKRPNNKFVGFAPEKIPTTVWPKITSTTAEPVVSTVMVSDVTTSGATETDELTTVMPDGSTVTKNVAERVTEEISTTSTSLESDEYSTITSNGPWEATWRTTMEDDALESTTDTVHLTNTPIEGQEVVEKADLLSSDSNETTTTTPPTTTAIPPKPSVPPTRPSNPLKENNLLSVLLSGLSNIFDATKNDSGKQSNRNRTEYRPITPKPIPISGFHKTSSIPSILESDVGSDYDEPTLPPSLPNLKIIPFLPADAVKKSDPLKPAKVASPTYTYFKNHPNNYPIVNDPYEVPTAYGIGNEHEILHPGLMYKTAAKPIGEYEYPYDPTINYPALTENYEIDAKNGYYNTKVIRDKYDTVDETDYDYDTDTIHKYSELPQKQDLFQNELKKFIPTKYEVPQEGSYVPVYDKYGVGYPEKNVYYTNHKELAYGGAKLDKLQSSTDNPYRIDATATSGFSPPTKTEGGFVPKEPHKEEFYYESYATTPSPIELTSDDHHAKLPYNATPTSSYGATPANPFIDVIRTEQAPPLMSLIEDKEKLLSFQANPLALEERLGDPSAGGDDYEKQIISITTDANYLSSVPSENDAATHPSTPSKPNFTGFELNFPVSVDHSVEPVSPTPKPVKAGGGTEQQEPEPSGMFSLENMLNYLLREEDTISENKLRNATRGDATPALADGIPPFKTLPSRLAAVYDPSAGLEASLGDVKPPSDEELHDGTVTLKVESAKNDTKALYRPSLSDLPFLNPGFHTKPINAPDTDAQNELDRYGYSTPEHRTDQYQVIAEGAPSVTNPNSYVVNPVDINKLKQHHSEGTAEINMKAKVKDSVGILKLAGCNIYGRMYRVGRIISELSGPCLECKCTEVGVHCTPLTCRKRR